MGRHRGRFQAEETARARASGGCDGCAQGSSAWSEELGEDWTPGCRAGQRVFVGRGKRLAVERKRAASRCLPSSSRRQHLELVSLPSRAHQAR